MDETPQARLFAAGAAAHAAGQIDRAEALYRQALDAEPGHAEALLNLAVLRAGAGQRDEAIALLRRAVAADPSTPEAHFNLGVLLADAGAGAASTEALTAALRLRPDYPEALTVLAQAQAAAGETDMAMALLQRAEAAAPQFTPALTTLGGLLMAKGRYLEAGQRFAMALHLEPGSAQAAYNVANALKALGRQAEAVAYYDKALDLAPGYVDALVNRANALREIERLDEAVETYRRALSLAPRDARLHLNLGQILRDRGDAEAARAALARAVTLEPESASARLAAVMAELPLVYADEADVAASRARYAAALAALADWASTRPRRQALASAIGTSQPFYLAYQAMDDRALQGAYGELVCGAAAEAYPGAILAPLPAADERIRVGVVSGFFRAHSNWKIPIRGWIAGLDRTRFEVFGYQTNARRDACTEEAEGLCDRFVQGPLSLDGWRERIAADAPHVLIYPEVGMDPTTARLASLRLAPVQCASWGHPDTTGFPTLDLYLSSELMEPEGAEVAYTERLIRLPGLGLWLEPPPAVEPMSRAALGLRQDETVFWCGQSLPKYLPRWDDVFPRIAAATSGPCRLVFIGLPQASSAEAAFKTRLAAAFARAGFDVDQYCLFLPRMNEAEFSRAVGAADLFLDSLDWSGCNSTLEAVAHGLPVITCPGGFMRGRHSAAILTLMGVDETIAKDVETYVALAARLAGDAELRAELRNRMIQGRERLYRHDIAVRSLENVLEAAVRQGANAA